MPTLEMQAIEVEGHTVKITNPDKLLWPEAGITKLHYIAKMTELAQYILPHAKDRSLTVIRYPDGIHGESFFQKSIPEYAPEWVQTAKENGITYILLNSAATLAWLATQAALELHTSFNLHFKPDNPTSLVFDLDPSKGQTFEDVTEAALIIRETLENLGIKSLVKTSGATGLQIYIPTGGRYDYDKARRINEFFARYFSQKHPELITVERIVKKREKKLYFDFLQMWYGKTITCVYSPRANVHAGISMPVGWDEVERGIKPSDFTLLNARERLLKKGDLFSELLKEENAQNLDTILEKIT